MKICIDKKSKEIIDIVNATIYIGEVEFKISVNKFNELVINKEQYSNGESSLLIKPSVSNEIRLL